ncbi:MAG: sensor domain-containing protein [Pseudomonadota bacterium]
MSLLPHRPLRSWRPPLMVGGTYLIFGLAWILFSDWLVHLMVPDRADLTAWQTWKGLAFVALSTLLLLVIQARETARTRAADRYWRDVIDRSREGFWLIDANGKTVTVNQAMADLLGYQPADLLGQAPAAFATAESQPRFEREIRHDLAPGGGQADSAPRRYEITLRTRWGEERPVLVQSSALYDDTGALTGAYAFLTDLRDIRLRERELELTRHALETSFDEILRLDAEGTVQDANQTACDNLGYPREDLLGRTIAELTPDYSLADYQQALWPMVQTRGKVAVETGHRTREGREYPVEAGINHIVYRGEEFAYWVGRDISRRKAAEDAYQRSNQALRALSRSNSALVRARDEPTLLEEVCATLVQTRDYLRVWVGLPGDDAQANPDGPPANRLRVAASVGKEEGDPSPEGQRIAARAMTEETTRVRRASGADEPPGNEEDPDGERPRSGGIAALPIHSTEATLGVLTVHAARPEAFDDEELALLEELAADLGFGIQALRMRIQRDQQLAELRLAGAVFENSAEGILVTDPEQRIERVNPAFTAITGYPASEVMGRTPALLQSGLQDEAFYRAMWAAIQSQGHWQGKIWNRRRNGETYPEFLSISEVRDEAGQLAHYIASFADITQAHRAREELTYRTYHDPLTDLPNRDLFRERLQRALATETEGLALLFIDLKGFRALNDTVGAEAGDTVLRRIAGRLQEAVGHKDTVARVGGDEFWVLLHGADRGQLDRCVAHLLALIGHPLELGEQTVRLEANMGVTLAPDDGTEMELLLTNAATALHRAQAESGGQVHYFRPEMQEAVRHRVQLEEALKVAIGHDELAVWFQPQVRLTDGAIEAVEALVRWHHPEWGMISPREFIPVAEQTGQVVAIGDWVLEEALRQMSEWRDAGYQLPRLAVNVAAAQLQRPDWRERVEAALKRWSIPPAALELEITEASLLASPSEARATLVRLKEMGVRQAIDDFGTGYSSLAYLKEFPVDTLKIDKAFVDGLPGAEHDHSITEAILAVAGALGQQVVAEGVETGKQADWLRERHVDWAQGFLYYRPMPATELMACLDPTRTT